jgi:glycosyltransferase involved in cell wall biosynthesis
MDLVAAGGERPQFRSAEAASGGPRPLGHVPDAHLPGLYAGASAFVLPSWHEGFGLTCIEAMACGVPVVAARAGALPETCGDAARYADPFDPDDIADQVLQAIGDDALAAKGRRRAAAFTWERTTAALHALLSGGA